MSKESFFSHPAMGALHRALQPELWLKSFFAGALMVVGLILFYSFFPANSLVAIIGLLAGVLGIRYVYYYLVYSRVEDSRLMFVLRHQPRRIVWVYSVVTQRLPFGIRMGSSCTLHFKLLDGEEIVLSLPQKKTKLVSRLLNRMLPHATFGYTEDRAQWYLASPELLLREEGEANGDS